MFLSGVIWRGGSSLPGPIFECERQMDRVMRKSILSVKWHATGKCWSFGGWSMYLFRPTREKSWMSFFSHCR